MKKLFMDVESAAKYIGFSVRHFRRIYYEDGKGKFFQIGRRFFVKTEDLEKWNKERKASA